MVMTALGLDENHDAGAFLGAIDALLYEAGAGDAEAVVFHHMGHNGERGDQQCEDHEGNTHEGNTEEAHWVPFSLR